MKYVCICILCIGLFSSCKSDSTSVNKTESSFQEVQPASLDEIVTDITTTDTINVAKMKFVETTFDFGNIEEGQLVEHNYTFTNTGIAPLTITNARSTCGCTVPEWPKEPIAPGQSGSIEVVFNSRGKKAKQNKPITIIANTHPQQTVVYLRGNVIAADPS
ncbi:MAG: DUF1573 domain-containing protein [Bacteroidia bacterium]|nr:DUF1573 domain-containing protein [Bacteroidia bacterium]